MVLEMNKDLFIGLKSQVGCVKVGILYTEERNGEDRVKKWFMGIRLKLMFR